MKKLTMATIAIIFTALMISAGCSNQPAKNISRPEPTNMNTYRNLCETYVAEYISQKGNTQSDADTSAQADKCMKTAEANGKQEGEKAFVERLMAACKSKSGKGAEWISCFNKETGGGN